VAINLSNKGQREKGSEGKRGQSPEKGSGKGVSGKAEKGSEPFSIDIPIPTPPSTDPSPGSLAEAARPGTRHLPNSGQSRKMNPPEASR